MWVRLPSVSVRLIFDSRSEVVYWTPVGQLVVNEFVAFIPHRPTTLRPLSTPNKVTVKTNIPIKYRFKNGFLLEAVSFYTNRIKGRQLTEKDYEYNVRRLYNWKTTRSSRQLNPETYLRSERTGYLGVWHRIWYGRRIYITGLHSLESVRVQRERLLWPKSRTRRPLTWDWNPFGVERPRSQRVRYLILPQLEVAGFLHLVLSEECSLTLDLPRWVLNPYRDRLTSSSLLDYDTETTYTSYSRSLRSRRLPWSATEDKYEFLPRIFSERKAGHEHFCRNTEVSGASETTVNRPSTCHLFGNKSSSVE